MAMQYYLNELRTALVTANCCESMCMLRNGKIEHCLVIKYFVKKGMIATEIHADMKSSQGNSAASFSVVSKWTKSL